jgi:hypothetical protein
MCCLPLGGSCQQGSTCCSQHCGSDGTCKAACALQIGDKCDPNTDACCAKGYCDYYNHMPTCCIAHGAACSDTDCCADHFSVGDSACGNGKCCIKAGFPFTPDPQGSGASADCCSGVYMVGKCT